MSTNILTPLPFSETGVRPGLWFLNSDESYSTITTPGFLNTVALAGYDLQDNDVIFTIFNANTEFAMLVVSITDGVYSLNVYSPNSNSFIFTQTQFVAKGGSDLNPGTSIGLPKLKIGSAISALMLSPSQQGVVIILDDGSYYENVVLPYSLQIWGPNASINCNSGDLLTINDSGDDTLAVINVAALFNYGSGKSVSISGALSNMFLSAGVIQGDIYDEGGLVLREVAQITSNIHITATGQFSPTIVNAIDCTFTFDTGSTIMGSIQTLNGTPLNQVYGDTTYLNHLMYQTPPSTETVGRTLAIVDSNTRVVYNAAVIGDYTLPQTSSVAIPIGTQITFVQLGIGAVSLVAGAGVTIIANQTLPVGTAGAGAVIYAWKYTDNIWIVSGDMATVSP